MKDQVCKLQIESGFARAGCIRRESSDSEAFDISAKGVSPRGLTRGESQLFKRDILNGANDSAIFNTVPRLWVAASAGGRL